MTIQNNEAEILKVRLNVKQFQEKSSHGYWSYKLQENLRPVKDESRQKEVIIEWHADRNAYNRIVRLIDGHLSDVDFKYLEHALGQVLEYEIVEDLIESERLILLKAMVSFKNKIQLSGSDESVKSIAYLIAFCEEKLRNTLRESINRLKIK